MFAVLILFIAILFGVEITNKDFVKQLFPITFQSCWYVGCYLFLYTIHPCLNNIITGLSQVIMLRVTVVMFLLCSCLSLIVREGYYYNFLIAFIMIYFIVGYMKLYLEDLTGNRKINFTIMTIGIVVI